MKDKKLKILSVALLINTLVIVLFLAFRQVGNNTILYETFSEIPKEGVYKIETIEDYLEFADTVEKGNDYFKCEIVLMNDLDFSNVDHVPVIGLGDTQKVMFRGTFNGNGHTLYGMKVINPDGEAAMFADFAGKILNLTLKEGYFEGNTAAGIAAELRSEGVILNCHADIQSVGELCGTFTGISRGDVFNCVGNGERLFADKRGGRIEECYLERDGQYISVQDETICLDVSAVVERLNQHLPRSGAFFGRTDMLRWSADGEAALSDEYAVLLQEVTAKIQMDRKEIKLKAYYSHNSDHWCIALPPGYHENSLQITAKNTTGKTEHFRRSTGEATILYTDGAYQHFIDFLPIQDADTLMIDLGDGKNIDDIHQNKKTEFSGILTVVDSEGSTESEYLQAIYGHGNDSWDADKKSYNLKFASETDVLGLGADEDFVLLAGYRDDSIMNYVATTTMIQHLNFPYSLDFKLVNLYVEGSYMGVYFLVEKLELDENRINLSSVYETMKLELGDKLVTYEFQTWKDTDSLAERYYYDVETNPEDISGTYLLELDVSDFDAAASRFRTTHGNRITMKRAQYSSKEQVNYVADYWQEFEDALYSADGYNKEGNYYADYIDLESFARQWLLYELVQENSMSSSVYFYKESEITGDGLLHACFPWDMEHSYLMYGPIDGMWLKDSSMSNGFWSKFWIHEDFRNMLKKLWNEEFLPVVEQMAAEEATGDDGQMKNLSWYKTQITNINEMEKSRWYQTNPYERCNTNIEFLKVRIETLSKLLNESLE